MLKRCLFIGLAMMLLAGVIGFIACGTGGIAGKYISEENPEEYLIIKDNGTFVSKEMGITLTGDWELDGNTLILSWMGFGMECEVRGNRIIDPDGEVWVKQNSSPEEEEVVLTPEPTALEHMLGYVSNIEKYKNRISFADPDGAKRLLGIEGFTKLEDLEDMPRLVEQMSPEQKEWMLNVAYVSLSRDVYAHYWRDFFGYTYLQAERSIKAGVPRDDFIVHEGRFDKGLIESKLDELGYERLEFLSTPYYALGADYEVDLNGTAYFAVNSMNRVALFDSTLVCTRATGVLRNVLEAVKGQRPSLQDVPAYAGLAQGMGAVTYAEILSGQEVREMLLNVRQDMEQTGIGEMEEFPSWGKLHQYQLIGIGFRYDEGERFLVISLFYEDDGAAARDEYELKQRLRTYVLWNRLPATEYWEVSDSRVLQTHGGSVLTVECRLIYEFQRALIVSELILSGDIIFLAVDASKL